jgi:hypothetical protein
MFKSLKTLIFPSAHSPAGTVLHVTIKDPVFKVQSSLSKQNNAMKTTNKKNHTCYREIKKFVVV